MRLVLVYILLFGMSCSTKDNQKETETSMEFPDNLISMLDTIWRTEQEPIRLRDSLMKIYGTESEEFHTHQLTYEKNHLVNERKIRMLLDKHGWPPKDIIGEQGNRTICNVLQHCENEIRIKYLPMMRQAVKEKQIPPRYLVRTEDRIATERGDPQIYGGQMKFYPETKSFNVWPVHDPVNIDKRRAEIGLEPIAVFLKNRFDFEWDLQEQIKRTAAFEKEQKMKKEKQ